MSEVSKPQKKLSPRKKKKHFKKKEIHIVKQPHTKIALIGFRGVGKSSIASELKKYWETKVVSLDRYIEERNKQPISHIVQEKGWAFFREEEFICLKEVSEEKAPILLDTGGGLVETADASPAHENMRILKENFFCIYLYMPKEKALQRLNKTASGNYRPSLNEDLGKTFDRRSPLYQKTASSVIDVSDAPIKDIIRRILGNF